MLYVFQIFLFSLLVSLSFQVSSQARVKRNLSYTVPEERIPPPLPENPSLPTNFSWQDVNGTNFLSLSRNHHLNQRCGSCYALVVATILSDRYKIQQKAQFPEKIFSFQPIISCSKNQTHGCAGGLTLAVYEWIAENGLSEDSCSPYLFKGPKQGVDCSGQVYCSTCYSNSSLPDGEECITPHHNKSIYVSHYDKLNNEFEIMREIYYRGPVACSVAVTPELVKFYGKEVFMDKSGLKNTDHVISVVGWGEEEGTGLKYWIVRNSWGEYWGDYGFFKLPRGSNTLGIESRCTFAIPSEVKTGSIDQKKQFSTPYLYLSKEHQNSNNYHPIRDGSNGPEIKLTTESAHKNFPLSWFWGNVNGQNYLDHVFNQNAPHYCNSGWAFSLISMLSTRSSIQRKNSWPKISGAAQSLLNCANKIGGSCNGANMDNVMKYVLENGVPLSTCMNYEAKSSEDCSELNICRYCDRFGCVGLAKFPKLKIESYGIIFGQHEMKEEIQNYGPIVCGVFVNDDFQSYTDGILKRNPYENPENIYVNHWVLVVGWEENAWIVKNSWGEFYGNEGYLKIEETYFDKKYNLPCYYTRGTIFETVSEGGYTPHWELQTIIIYIYKQNINIFFFHNIIIVDFDQLHDVHISIYLYFFLLKIKYFM